MEGRYNIRSPAVKRLMREAQELSEPTDQYFAQPLEDNLFEWHFTVRGPADSDFQNGVYHGRIVLPVDYPMKPPSIIWLTPNGRFETNKKICLSISGHHPESWQPSWSIRTALLAIIGFMPTHSGGAIGSLEYTPEERKVLAKKSRDWKCPSCGDVQNVLLEPSAKSAEASEEAKELAAQINFQGEKPKQGGAEPKQGGAEPKQGGAEPKRGAEKPDMSSGSSPPDSTKEQQSPPQTSVQEAASIIGPPVSTTTLHALSSSLCMPPAPPPPLPSHTLWSHMHPPLNPQASHQIANMIPRFPYPPSHYQNSFTGSLFPPLQNSLPYPPFNPGQPSNSAQTFGINTESVSSNVTSAVPVSTPDHDIPSLSTEKPESEKKNPEPSRGSGIHKISSQSSPSQGEALSSKVVAEPLDNIKLDSVLNKESAHENNIKSEKNLGDSSITEDVLERSLAHGNTESEVSLSLKKKDSLGDIIPPDLSQQDLPVNGEDSASDLSLDIGEREPRSGPYFSASSVVKGQETRKNRLGTAVRQSATAPASLVTDEDSQPASGAAAASAGQRIEAAVGDIPTQLRPRHHVVFNNAAQNIRVRNYQIEQLANRQRSLFNFDNVTNVVLICLTLVTMFILLNRIIRTVGIF